MVVVVVLGFVLQVVVLLFIDEGIVGVFADPFILDAQVGVGATVLCGTGAGCAAAFGMVQADLGVPEGVGAFLLVFEEAAFCVPGCGAFFFCGGFT